MTERLATIQQHITSITQLGSVVGAMRGVAAARVQQTRQVIEGVRAWSAIIEAALGDALSLLPTDDGGQVRRGRSILVLFTAEHGFVGALPERMVAASAPDRAAGALVYCLGARGAALAEAEGWQPAWIGPMATQLDAATAIASRVAGTIYDTFLHGGATRVDVLFPLAAPDGRVTPERRSLLPLDLSRFRRPPTGERPLTYLPTDRLVEMLVGEYVMAELARAAFESFTAENEERLRTMQSARANIDNRLEDLQMDARRARQTSITEELLDVMSGSAAVHEFMSRRGQARNVCSQALMTQPSPQHGGMRHGRGSQGPRPHDRSGPSGDGIG